MAFGVLASAVLADLHCLGQGTIELKGVEGLVDGIFFPVLDMLYFRLYSRFYLFLYFFLSLWRIERDIMSGDLVGPVIDIVHFYFVILPGCRQQVLEILIIWFFLELESLGVVDEEGKFVGKPFAQELRRGGYFLLHYHLVLGFSILSLHVLPGKYAPQ